jgi:iron complex transport system ATP-binding protein
LTAQDEAVVQWALQSVGATHLAGRNANELSDGERQKIMIARALAQEPELMLLDEPTAFLDLPRRVEIMGLLRELAHTTGRAILLSTHDLDLALRSADRIWLMATDGNLHVGAPEDLVLSGAFAEVFHSEGVTFDPQTGSFIVSRQDHGQVSLTGSGLSLIWTRRALERAGFSIASNGAGTLAKIAAHDDHWTLTHDGTTETYDTLYDLMHALSGDSIPSHTR